METMTMTNEQILTAISSLISLLGICYLLFWRYQPLFLDAFRQDMFGLRDELFDYAAAGKIDFGHPAYVLLRTIMNGSIRFGYHISAWQGVLFAVLISRDKDLLNYSFSTVWDKATSDLDTAVKDKLHGFLDRAQDMGANYFFLTSPYSLFWFIPLVIFMTIRRPDLVTQVQQKAKKRVEQIESARASRKLGTRQESKELFSQAALIYGEHGHPATAHILHPVR
jgi:hypothetical protein